MGSIAGIDRERGIKASGGERLDTTVSLKFQQVMLIKTTSLPQIVIEHWNAIRTFHFIFCVCISADF